MLVLTRRPRESILIGDDIRIVILEVRGEQVRVGIAAPRDVRVDREEVADIRAAEAVTSTGSSAFVREVSDGK